MESNSVCNHSSDTKSDDRATGVRFVYHEYDYGLNWTTRSLITNNHKNYNLRETKNSQVIKIPL